MANTLISEKRMIKRFNNIDYLWNSNNLKDWTMALDYYFDLVKSSNIELEKELDNLNPEQIKRMDTREFYEFLHNKYFVWKYTQPNRLKTTRMSLEKYITNDSLDELEEIHYSIFNTDLKNTSACLKNVQRIKGLGIAGASGLLSLLFPKYFGTVDQFVVQRLLEINNLEEHTLLERIKKDNISLTNGTILINIMKSKATELNSKFKTEDWTPRKIDKILWSIGRYK